MQLPKFPDLSKANAMEGLLERAAKLSSARDDESGSRVSNKQDLRASILAPDDKAQRGIIGAGLAQLSNTKPQTRRALAIGAAVAVVIGAGQIMESSKTAIESGEQIAAVVGNVADVSAVAGNIAAPQQPSAQEVIGGMSVAALSDVRRAPSLEAAKPVADLVPVEPVAEKLNLDALAMDSELIVSDGGYGFTNCTEPSLALTEGLSGLVAIEFVAPCATDSVVSISQSDVTFKVKTDVDGRLRIEMPALASQPEITVDLPDGTRLTASLTLATPINGERVVLNWEGSQDVALNAYENGAEFGGSGHVFAAAERGEGGYVTRLGDADLLNPKLAEIYVARGTQRTVTFDFEVAVTDATCAQDLSITLVRYGKTARERDTLTLAMPECDAIGDAVVMTLPQTDMTLALAQ
ncbi:hypothetical protein [Albirhodobacter sp. R86504]|uniref:hypothetical protein n=1 Tax=Albirhodobacter sp. R86504 TaxID=3093848 RepID=UPI00366A971A